MSQTTGQAIPVLVRALFCVQVTWNALGHLPFAHWMRAHGALSRVHVQAEYFYSAWCQLINFRTPPPAYDPVHTEHDVLAVDLVHPRLGQHQGAAFVRHPHASGALLREV
jgi:hypothetical protein